MGGGLFSSCGGQASYCSGFSAMRKKKMGWQRMRWLDSLCCGALALGVKASVVVTPGL